MKSDDLNSQHHTNKSKRYLSPKVGLGLIALMVFYYSFSQYIFSAVGVDYVNSLYLHAISAYAMIVFSILFFSPNVLEVFRDHFTLWIIVLGCFLPIAFEGGNTMIYKGVFIFLGSTLAVYIIANRNNIKFPGVKLAFTGLAWSVGAVLIIALIYALLDQTYTKSFPSNLPIMIVQIFRYQLSFVAVIEEAQFRGLLFCFMVMNGYKEDKAFVVQAVLFWAIHFGDIITSPTLFLIIIPLTTFFLTLVIKKYKMLYMSIMMHAFVNVFTTALVTLINRHLF